MSAAKLAAEARRAKILARASKNTVSAVGADDEEVSLGITCTFNRQVSCA